MTSRESVGPARREPQNVTSERAAAVRRGSVLLDGHRMSFLQGGPADGPAIIFVHGLLADATTWARCLPGLAGRGLRVVALDLLGHGQSDKPADAAYSIEGFTASVVRVLDELGIDRATVAGHSLGGGTAIGVSYLHPERVERLVLVSSGGFGTDLHPVLRGATLPGARRLVEFAVSPRVSRVLAAERLHRSVRLRPEAVENLARMGRNLRSNEGRAAFFATLSENVDSRGQRGSMMEMGYVNADLPTLLVWSERDPIIPVAHARAAQRYLARSQLEIFPGVSHEPHRRHVDRFVDVVADFVGARPA